MGAWATGEVLGLDFETTGVDRFSDVPVSYALVLVVEGVVVRSWSGLIDPGCEIPVEATAVHGISTERARAEGMPLDQAIGLVADAVVAAGRRGVPLVGMRLDYDLTILDRFSSGLFGVGLTERGWRGPVLDAGVIDRHVDPDTRGAADAQRPVRSLRDRARARTRCGSGCDGVDRGAVRAGPAVPRPCGSATWRGCTQTRWRGTASGRRATTVGGGPREWGRSIRVTWCGRWRRPCSRRRPEQASGGRRRLVQALSRSQTMSTPSFSARTTLAGCILSMWPTRPL